MTLPYRKRGCCKMLQQPPTMLFVHTAGKSDWGHNILPRTGDRTGRALPPGGRSREQIQTRFHRLSFLLL